MDKTALIAQLNRLLRMEPEGVVRNLHHAFMVVGWEDRDHVEALQTYVRTSV